MEMEMDLDVKANHGTSCGGRSGDDKTSTAAQVMQSFVKLNQTLHSFQETLDQVTLSTELLEVVLEETDFILRCRMYQHVVEFNDSEGAMNGKGAHGIMMLFMLQMVQELDTFLQDLNGKIETYAKRWFSTFRAQESIMKYARHLKRLVIKFESRADLMLKVLAVPCQECSVQDVKQQRWASSSSSSLENLPIESTFIREQRKLLQEAARKEGILRKPTNTASFA